MFDSKDTAMISVKCMDFTFGGVSTGMFCFEHDLPVEHYPI